VLSVARTAITIRSLGKTPCIPLPGEIVELSPHVPGAVVECRCFLGGSTAKLSLAAAVAGRRLIVCDSSVNWWRDNMHSVPPRLVGAGTGLGRLSPLIGYVCKG
jgi:hypothetical protein